MVLPELVTHPTPRSVVVVAKNIVPNGAGKNNKLDEVVILYCVADGVLVVFVNCCVSKTL